MIFYISNFIVLIRDNCLITDRNYTEAKLIHQLVINIIWVLKIKYVLNINYENFKKIEYINLAHEYIKVC